MVPLIIEGSNEMKDNEKIKKFEIYDLFKPEVLRSLRYQKA